MRRLVLTLALTLVAAGLGAGGAAARLSPDEQAWVKPVLKIYDAMAANLGVVVDEERASDALIPRSGKNNTLLTYTLTVFVSCPAEVKAAGSPPSLRLGAFYADMVSACGALAAGANDVAKALGQILKGDGSRARSDLAASTPELLHGSKLLTAAEKQLMAIGGKAVFEA